MADDTSLEDLARGAIDGDAIAVDRLVRALKDPVYALSLRTLGDRGDAEDATQEILLKVITHLSSFRFEAKLLTWVYRVALNHLLTAKAKRARQPAPSFEEIGGLLDAGLAHHDAAGPQSAVDVMLVDEMRVVCTQGMLQALDRDHRLAFVLSDIVELAGADAAEILEITPETYRKRVSRARERLADFMRPRCGVYDAENLCRCDKQVPFAQQIGLMPKDLVEIGKKPSAADAGGRELLGLLDVALVIKRHPEIKAPERIAAALRAALGAPPVH